MVNNVLTNNFYSAFYSSFFRLSSNGLNEESVYEKHGG